MLEPKIDGLTVVLHYRNGLFVQGATRGDGEVGEDITGNLRTVRAIPLKIPIEDNGAQVPDYLVVRAEAFIMLKDFEKLNQELSEKGEKDLPEPAQHGSRFAAPTGSFAGGPTPADHPGLRNREQQS